MMASVLRAFTRRWCSTAVLNEGCWHTTGAKLILGWRPLLFRNHALEHETEARMPPGEPHKLSSP